MSAYSVQGIKNRKFNNENLEIENSLIRQTYQSKVPVNVFVIEGAYPAKCLLYISSLLLNPYLFLTLVRLLRFCQIYIYIYIPYS